MRVDQFEKSKNVGSQFSIFYSFYMFLHCLFQEKDPLMLIFISIKVFFFFYNLNRTHPAEKISHAGE